MRIYPIQMSHIRLALERLIGQRIDVVTSNCGCFYGDLRSAIASLSNYGEVLTDKEVTFIKLPHFRMKKGLSSGSLLRAIYRFFSELYRGMKYARLTRGKDIVHFHQSADAFGHESLRWFLRFAKPARTVVTVYRFAPAQTERPWINVFYNSADAVIVSTEHAKRFLVEAGVHDNRVHVVPYGATLESMEGTKRQGAIMFAGSPLVDVKGFQYLAPALKLLRDSGTELRLKMHGYYTPGQKEWAVEVAQKHEVADLIDWVGFANEQELIKAYQSSQLCVIPYTEYSGCFPVTLAMANGTPVVATDAMGIPEYTNGAGLIVKAGSAEDLAVGIRKVLSDPALQARMATAGREIAEKRFGWDTLARKVLDVYRNVTAG